MSIVRVRLREWESTQVTAVDLGGSAGRELARRLTEARVIEITELRGGVHIQALAHVGRIQLGDLLITIEAKIGASELLELLRYAYGFRDLRLFESTDFAHTGDLLHDLLAAQLLAEVTELVDRGVAKKYVERAEELATPRGRIDLRAIALRVEPAATLPCRHHTRSADHLLNKVMRAGVQLGADVAQEPTLRSSLRRLGASMAMEIGDARLDADTLARARRQVNRLTTAYLPSLRLIELLYACAAVSLDDETATPLPGFLFDMNRFFQALMGRFLDEHLDGYELRPEYALTEMMRYLPGMNPRRRKSPTPRPDFVVAQKTKVICLLDAKYRDLWERELPRDMLYQLAIYALSQQRPSTATILYPTANPHASPAVIELSDPVGPGALGFVELRPVVLSVLLDALRGGNGSARETLARQLAFGAAG